MNRNNGRPPTKMNTAHSHGRSSVNFKTRVTNVSYGYERVWGSLLAIHFKVQFIISNSKGPRGLMIARWPKCVTLDWTSWHSYSQFNADNLPLRHWVLWHSYIDIWYKCQSVLCNIWNKESTSLVYNWLNALRASTLMTVIVEHFVELSLYAIVTIYLGSRASM